MSERVDVVVVGAGTAGLNAALQLSRTGRSVVVLERRPEGQSGARWCNGVLAWQFDRAGIGGPTPDEVRSHSDGRGRTHMVSPSGRHSFVLPSNPILEADMRALVERLRREAADAGVDLRWGVRDVEVELDRAQRPRAVRATHDDEPIRIEADLFVDAAGYQGVLRSQVPAIDARCPAPGPDDLCSAQQLVLEIDDPGGAERFLKERDAELGDGITQVGMAGGYSTINIQVAADLSEVSVLTGSIPATGAPTGPELVKQVREREDWMGATVFGGGGLIPLRRTYEELTAPGIALVGDAASQVMAGHGSGIGFGLIAGKVLAEATTGAADPGAADVLWRYQARFHREFGAILAGYDAVRRMSVRLGPEGVETMFATGVFSPDLVIPGLDQRLGTLKPRQAMEAAQRLARNGSIAREVVPALTAMTTARALYRAYPDGPGRAFDAWLASVRRLLPRQAA